MEKFNETCDKVRTAKDAGLGISAKLLSLGRKPGDVPADGNCFLHAARFALPQLKNLNLTLLPTVAAIRSALVRFLSNARMNAIMDGHTLDEMRGGMEDLNDPGKSED